jgi:D-beta-D-heptose 7-phosphate kinase/D-beta-D-heptose 1-phosphate adenosyltransferase
VAHNLAVLGARVSLVGVVGADNGAERLRRELAAVGISADGLVQDSGRPTTEKVRVVTERNQQVARIDYEDDGDLGEGVENAVIGSMRRAGKAARALIVSDYLKGVVTPAVLRTLVDLKSEGTPLLIDPKIPHLESYAGATLVTPNHREAEAATGRRILHDEDARDAAFAIRRRAGDAAVLITRGEQGMWLSCDEVEGGIPAVAREVADVTGAGDTVIAVLGLGLAAGATMREAAILANHAAGIVVGKFGPATVNTDQLLSRFDILAG